MTTTHNLPLFVFLSFYLFFETKNLILCNEEVLTQNNYLKFWGGVLRRNGTSLTNTKPLLLHLGQPFLPFPSLFFPKSVSLLIITKYRDKLRWEKATVNEFVDHLVRSKPQKIEPSFLSVLHNKLKVKSWIKSFMKFGGISYLWNFFLAVRLERYFLWTWSYCVVCC